MRKTVTIMLGILLLASISAIEIEAGSCGKIDFPNENKVSWSVKGNSSNLDGFSYSKEGTIITYCFDMFFVQDNFTITFYNSLGSVDVENEYQYGGGSGTTKKKEVVNETINETEETKKPTDEEAKEIISSDTPLKEDKGGALLTIIIAAIFLAIIIFLVYKYSKEKNE